MDDKIITSEMVMREAIDRIRDVNDDRGRRLAREMGEVMIAYANGAEIQKSSRKRMDGWEDAGRAMWNWKKYIYRVKP